MKDIKKFINENKKGWSFVSSTWDNSGGESLSGLNRKDVKWLFISTETEILMPVTEKDLEGWSEDFGDDTLEKEVKALKIGDSYDADGGISIYVRIKK